MSTATTQQSIGAEAMLVLRTFLEASLDRQFTDQEIRIAAGEAAMPLNFEMEVLNAIQSGPGEDGKYDISPAMALYFGVRMNRVTEVAAKIATAVKILTSN